MDAMTKIGQLVMEASKLKEVIANLYSLTVQLGEQRDTARKSCTYWQGMYESACKNRDEANERTGSALKLRQQVEATLWRTQEALDDVKDNERSLSRQLSDAHRQLDALKYDVALVQHGPLAHGEHNDINLCDGFKCVPSMDLLMARHSIQKLDDEGCWVMGSVDDDLWYNMPHEPREPDGSDGYPVEHDETYDQRYVDSLAHADDVW